MNVRTAQRDDMAFLIEMSRLASTLDDRPVPAPDDPGVAALLPEPATNAVVAADADGRPIGAAWWLLHDPPLLPHGDGDRVPELVIAVVPEARRRGVGTALVEALVGTLAQEYERVALNVHLLNPATHLYVRTGFRVAGHGRGIYGVAMVRDL